MSRSGRRVGRVELKPMADKGEQEAHQQEGDEHTEVSENSTDRKCSCTTDTDMNKAARKASVFNFQDYTVQQQERRRSSPDLRGIPKVCHSDEPVLKPPAGYDTEGYQVLSRNSYVMEPPKKFDVARVKKIVIDELKKVQDICKHNHNGTCLHLCEEIKRRVKTLGLLRYRYVVMVTISENKQQGFNMATKFFWDQQFDGFVSESHEINGSFIIAVVYGIYCM